MFKNGNHHRRIGRSDFAGGETDGLYGTTLVALAPGDYIDVRLYLGGDYGGTLVGDTSQNHVQIVRIPGS